jgi:hypothetical protein
MRERDRSRFPLREPIDLHRQARADRTLSEREGNDPGASLCLKAPITLVIPESPERPLGLQCSQGVRPALS